MKHFTVFNKKAGGFSTWEAYAISGMLNESLEGKIAFTSSTDELKKTLTEYKNYHPDIFGIGGGDGTQSKTLTLVNDIWGYIPTIALYPLGTINNWAVSLNLSDGLVDKVKKVFNVFSTKAINLAEYICGCAHSGENLNTKEVDLLDVSGRKGFNVGFAAVSKLVWTYYGKNIDQYRRLEKEISECSCPEQFEWRLKRICDEQSPLFVLLDTLSNGSIRKTGATYCIGTAVLSILSSLTPLSRRTSFYEEPFDGEIYLDRKKFTAPVNAIYVSSYDQVSLGVPMLNFNPSPRAKIRGKMEVVLCKTSMLKLVEQLPQLFLGKHLDGVDYVLCSELELNSNRPIVGQLEADLFIEKNKVVIKKDRSVKVISPRNI